MADVFNFEDFFVSADDPGASVDLVVGNRTVPIKIKRNMTLQDLEECKSSAVVTRINPKDGTPELVSVDENEFTIQVLLRMIKSWPFTYANGDAVPINRPNLESMMATGAQALQQLVFTIVNNKDNSPFAQPSVEA